MKGGKYQSVWKFWCGPGRKNAITFGFGKYNAGSRRYRAADSGNLSPKECEKLYHSAGGTRDEQTLIEALYGWGVCVIEVGDIHVLLVMRAPHGYHSRSLVQVSYGFCTRKVFGRKYHPIPVVHLAFSRNQENVRQFISGQEKVPVLPLSP